MIVLINLARLNVDPSQNDLRERPALFLLIRKNDHELDPVNPDDLRRDNPRRYWQSIDRSQCRPSERQTSLLRED